MKKRLDILVAEKLEITRSKAQALIMAGSIIVEGKALTKSGIELEDDAILEVKETFPYVSRGALKLKEAAEKFNLDFKNKVVADIGASTGGFTDFVLQEGATKVFAIDTGKGQIAQKLRDDNRVMLFENTNIKVVNSLPEPIDFFVIDVSFISLKKVLPRVIQISQTSNLKPQTCNVIALIKPQFEVGKEIADRYKGIIRDSTIQNNIVDEMIDFAKSLGYRVEGVIDSPITGAKGNKEFLIYLKKEK